MLDLSKRYKRAEFINFLRNFLPSDTSFDSKQINISSEFNFLKTAWLIGKSVSLENLSILEVEHTNSEKKRVQNTRDLFKLVKRLNIRNALVVSYSPNSVNYRFSFIKNFLSINKNRIFQNFTSPKRFSFLLGENSKINTAYKQLSKPVKNLEELINRFNIEIVTDEFFEDYKNLYLKLYDFFKNDRIFKEYSIKYSLDLDLFSKKIIGQIVFCYFIQKKGWLGASKNQKIFEGDVNFFRNQFDKINANKKNFYNDFLEILFYEGLNKNNTDNYCLKLDVKVPYLNGGLFQSLENYNWKDRYLNIPNSFFSNDSKDGILDVFDLYNFTIDENDDLDSEIGIDPEMLGRIFESLLPENLKKTKGTHYTPKEIVEYMCLETIKDYLERNHDKKYHIFINQILNFSRFPEETISFKEENIFPKDEENMYPILNSIDKCLSDIKVCDPCVGSGAFILGSLNLIINIKKIIYLFLNKKNINFSKIKRELIQNNLYGIDIDSGAVEICKLRLWLSLAIDEKDVIEPLPNLDFKIVQGNSLLEQFEGINLDISYNNNTQLELGFNANILNEKFDQLKNLQKNYYQCTNSEDKYKSIKNINKIYYEILKEQISNKLTINNDNKKKLINSLNNFRSITEDKNYLPWKLIFLDVFLEKNGFDIILANPPYLREKDNSKIFDPVNNSFFGKKYHNGKMNYWYYFLYKAIDKSNSQGTIAFITNRYWINSFGAKKLIHKINSELFIKSVLDLNKIKVFEKVSGQHIVFIYSKKVNETTIYKNIKNNLSDIFSIDDTENIKISVLKKAEIFTANNQINFNIKEINLISSKFKKLDDFFIPSTGIQESPDKVSSKMLKEKPDKNIKAGEGVFVLNNEELKNLKLNNNEMKIIKKYLNPNEVDIYKINFKNNYIIYSTPDILHQFTNNEFPNIKKHLDRFKKYITSSNGPYGLHRSRNSNFFTNPKIILKCMFLKPEFVYDENEYFFGFSFISIVPKSKLSLKFLLGLLNSSFGFYWFINNTKRRGIGFDITNDNLKQFPIPVVNNKKDEKIINEIVNLVEKILRKFDLDILNKIDEKIYSLCCLSKKDIFNINKAIDEYLNINKIKIN